DLFEDLEVGEKSDLGPVGVGLLAFGEFALRLAALVVLRPDVAVGVDLGVEPLVEGVNDRDADAVQPAGDLVAAAVPELAAGMEDGEHDLGGRFPLFLHDPDRNPAAVVLNRAGVGGVQYDLDAVAVTSEGLVDRVVDHLVDEMVKAARAGRADVHAGAFANGFQTLEDGDVLGAVGVAAGFFLRQ